jgi:hypothetical protein
MFAQNTDRVAPAQRCPVEAPARSGAAAYVAGLKADLGISETQTAAWAGFAEALLCNRRRMQAVDTEADHPFGAVHEDAPRSRICDGRRASCLSVFAPASSNPRGSCCRFAVNP